MGEADPHDEIARLEAEIEALAEKLAGCRKFILAGRFAAAAGALLIVATFLGVIYFDPRVFFAGIAAVLGGLVAWGSNISTANEAAAEIADAERERARLIGALDLRPVASRPTLH